MRVCKIIFLCLVGVPINCWADSLLTAEKFPKTFQDVGFVDRMKFLAEDYMLYERQYDSAGNCISGCPYAGINIIDDMKDVDDATAKFADMVENNTPTDDTEAHNATTKDNTEAHNATTNNTVTSNVASNNVVNVGGFTALPLRSPIKTNNLILTSDFGFRKSVGYKFHPAIDIGVPDGTPVYATADGVVDFAGWDSAGGGNYVKISHTNGVFTRYLHLQSIMVKKGQKIGAGQQIGLSGHSGGDYGPHLDYRISFNNSSKGEIYIDVLCMIKASSKGQAENASDPIGETRVLGNYGLNNGTLEHSALNHEYRFDSQNSKRIDWRIKHKHCLPNNMPGKHRNQLPDEIM